MQLTIESIKTNPSGKSIVVKAGGRDYLAKVGMPLQAGMTIDAELKDSQFNGKTNTWIEKWKQVNVAPQTMGNTQPVHGAAVSGSSAGAAPVWLPFLSNTVAHAIQAGLITDPSHIKLWAAAAKQAFVELV